MTNDRIIILIIGTALVGLLIASIRIRMQISFNAGRTFFRKIQKTRRKP